MPSTLWSPTARLAAAQVRKRRRDDQHPVAQTLPLACQVVGPELHAPGRRAGIVVEQQDVHRPARACRRSTKRCTAGSNIACCCSQARLAAAMAVGAPCSACSATVRQHARCRARSARCRHCAPARGWPAGRTTTGYSRAPSLRAPTPTPNRSAAGSGTSARAHRTRPARPRPGGRQIARGPAVPGCRPAPAWRRAASRRWRPPSAPAATRRAARQTPRSPAAARRSARGRGWRRTGRSSLSAGSPGRLSRPNGKIMTSARAELLHAPAHAPRVAGGQRTGAAAPAAQPALRRRCARA